MTIAVIEEPGGLVGNETLDELAEVGNRAYADCVEYADRALAQAFVAGHAWNAAYDHVPRGEWLGWVAANCVPRITVVTRCRLLARYEPQLVALGADNITQGVTLLRHRGLSLSRTKRHTPLQVEARMLRTEGLSIATIAEHLGCSRSSVWNALNPGKAEANNRRYYVQYRAAKKALWREQRALAAQRVGGDIAKAYSLARAYAETLQRALDSEGDPDARTALTAALQTHYRSEDKLNEAIGTSKPREDK